MRSLEWALIQWTGVLKRGEISTDTHGDAVFMRHRGRRQQSASQEERLRKKPAMLTPWPQIASLQNWEKINFSQLLFKLPQTVSEQAAPAAESIH